MSNSIEVSIRSESHLSRAVAVWLLIERVASKRRGGRERMKERERKRGSKEEADEGTNGDKKKKQLRGSGVETVAVL
jgi:hypothetical protein